MSISRPITINMLRLIVELAENAAAGTLNTKSALDPIRNAASEALLAERLLAKRLSAAFVEHRGYQIQLKQDFPFPYALIEGMPCRWGYVVTQHGVNALPGATWFRTVSDARLAIDTWIDVAGNAEEFWRRLSNPEHRSEAVDDAITALQKLADPRGVPYAPPAVALATMRGIAQAALDELRRSRPTPVRPDGSVAAAGEAAARIASSRSMSAADLGWILRYGTEEQRQYIVAACATHERLVSTLERVANVADTAAALLHDVAPDEAERFRADSLVVREALHGARAQLRY